MSLCPWDVTLKSICVVSYYALAALSLSHADKEGVPETKDKLQMNL
jgi:hypothetical protein